MSNTFGFIDIILLAMIAGFILLRLRNILGRKTGHEGKVSSIFDEKKFEEYKAQLSAKAIVKDTLEKDEEKQFLKGAEMAYETIITSFAKGNKDKITSELTFIGVKESKLEKFEKIKNDLFATVKIICEIISVKKKGEEIIEGNPDRIKTVTDHWKFTKSATSKNPNWFLAEIVSK